MTFLHGTAEETGNGIARAEYSRQIVARRIVERLIDFKGGVEFAVIVAIKICEAFGGLASFICVVELVFNVGELPLEISLRVGKAAFVFFALSI